MFCIKCGTEYKNEGLPFGKSKFCKNCGELLYKGEATNFIQSTVYSVPAETQPANKTYTSENQQNTNTVTYVFIGIMLAIIIGTGGWYLMNYNKHTEEVATEETTESTEISETDNTNSVVVQADSIDLSALDDEQETDNRVKLENPLANRTSSTEQATEYLEDDYFKNTIQSYYDAEKLRNFDNLYNSYLSNLEHFYDLTSPSYEQLSKRFNATWNITSDIKNTIKTYNITRYDNSIHVTIVLDYSYYGLKVQQYKTVNDITVIFNFNQEGKIKSIFSK